MYFGMKSYLKNTRNYTAKHALNLFKYIHTKKKIQEWLESSNIYSSVIFKIWRQDFKDIIYYDKKLLA
jgi:hypothetical protein